MRQQGGTFRRDRDRACRTGAVGARYGRNTRAQSRGDAKTVRSPADGQLYVESTTRCLPDRHHRACPLSLPHSPFLRPWPGASERPACRAAPRGATKGRSEEHTSALQSLMRISYAVLCLKKKNITSITTY